MNQKIIKMWDKKNAGIPISVVTAYDYPTAKIAEEVGIDIILVGDSVGTNVLGYTDETEVTMADMIHHVKAVAKGASNSCIMADLPFGSAPDPFAAFENSRILVGAGADIIKIEGWADRKNTVAYVGEMGIPVCCHIGYNPQYHGSKGKVFGKDIATVKELVNSARLLEKAGAAMMVVEKVPEEVCRHIASVIEIPVIGIGSGRFCAGQVLVFHDVAGLSERSFRHARAFGNLRSATTEALTAYKDSVERRLFPSEEQVVHVDPSLLQGF